MKRWIAVGLLAVACVTMAGTAFAVEFPHQERIRVKWLTCRAATPGGGCTDSAVVRYGAAGSKIDTTEAISLTQMVPAGRFASGADSSYILRFGFTTTGNLPASAGTVTFTPQVSDNGTDWVPLFTTLTITEVGTANDFQRTFMSIQQASAAPTGSSFLGWGLIRFIVATDHIGEFMASVRYFKAS